MKNLIRLLAVIALMATAAPASAAQVFVYIGSSVLPPGGIGASLCGVALCSSGAVADDFRLTLTLDDGVTSISHSDAGVGSKPTGFVSIVLETQFDSVSPLTVFQTVSDDTGATNNVLPLFEEFEVSIVGGVVRTLLFGFIDPVGPNPRGGLRADSGFSFGVTFLPSSLGCDPFGGDAPANGCALSNDPWIAFGSGDFNGAAIPVPAAVWLFGSALGLLGWVRRRQVS